VLTENGIESHVVDPASIATSRRRRRAKTDKLDGDTVVRDLLAYKRGEPRVCAMVRAPTPEEEDRRRLSREHRVLLKERVQHSNRIKGLLFGQGVTAYEPLRRDRRQRLVGLQTGDGRSLPPHLKAQIDRELDRLEMVLEQIRAIEDELRHAIVAADTVMPVPRMLIELKGIGDEFATVLWTECLYRRFDNRRQVAAYARLAPTPWQSGSIDREQGVSKAGNPRLRAMLLQLAWLWLRHQPDSVLSQWFLDRVKANGGRLKKPTIVALARKLLVALWKYVTSGIVIEGATVRAAVIVNFVDPIRSPQGQTPGRVQVDEPIDGMAFQRRLSEWFHLSELLPAASGIMVQPSERRPNVRLNGLEDEQVHVAWAQATEIEDRENRRARQPGPPD